MLRPSRLVFFFFLMLTAVAAQAGSQANVPDWVATLAAQPVGTYPPRTDAVVLLDETTNSVSGATEYVETRRRVVRILRPEGRNERFLGIEYEKDDKVLGAHVWSIDPTGKQYEVKEKDFVDVGEWGAGYYNETRHRGAEAPAADVGSVVASEFSVRHRLWIPKDTWYFQEDIPVKVARYTLELPAGWEHKEFWVNASPVQPTASGASAWQWVRTDVPGIMKEKHRPALHALSGRMELTYFGPGVAAADSWKSIGDWYNGLTRDRRSASPEIESQVQRLIAGKSGFASIVRALGSFVQSEVRYVAIEIGIGGYQPHPAADVFKNRYGDCKDKATLLSTMLKVAGIRSHYVIIYTNRGIARADAPATTFNHAILAIELPKDAPNYRSVVTAADGRKMLIFDPTDDITPVGELRGDLQGNVAMLVTENGGEVITTPMFEPASNVVARDGKFTLNTDGTLKGDVVEKRTGENAFRFRLAVKDSHDAERTKIVERYFGQFLNGAAILEANFDNLSQIDQDLIVRYKLASGKYAQNAGPLVLVRPRVLGDMNLTIDWKDRKYPVEMGAPSLRTDTYEITIPDGFVVDDVPPPAKVDVGFATYNSNIDVAGNTIRYHREYAVKDLQVPLEKLADLRRLQEEIGNDENGSVVLKKK